MIRFVVKNPLFEEGMATFMKAGLRELPADMKAFCVGICDQPLLTGELIREFIDAFLKGGKKVLVPVQQTNLGMPVILDASCSGGTITKYEWFADGESVSDSSTMDQYFPLDAEESSKDVAVRLEITTLE